MSAAPRLLARHAPADAVSRDRSCRDLLRDAAAVAACVEPARRSGEEVLLLCQDRYRFACALLAAVSRGLVIALPPSAQPDMVRALRQRDRVRTVLHDVDGMPGLDVRERLGRSDVALEVPTLSVDAPFAVVYTSGTTGQPLACPKTAGQLLGEAEVLARTFAIGSGDRIVATVPPHHIYGLLFGLLVPLVSGASFAREGTLHAEPLAALWNAERGTVLVSVPAHLRGLAVLDPHGFTVAPRRVFSSGAPLPRATSVMLASRFGWSVTEVLGSSETGGLGHRIAAQHAEEPAAPFTTFEGVRVREGEGGRMEVDSPFLHPSMPRPFVSSDRVVVVDEMRFQHLGRADGVIKVGGTRVSLQEIEARLLAVPGVIDAHVWAVPVPGPRAYETRAVVAGRGADGAPLGVDVIRRELLRWLEPVVLPRRIRVVDALPREANGKLRKDALDALFRTQRADRAEDVD